MPGRPFQGTGHSENRQGYATDMTPTAPPAPRVLLLPGWLDSGPGHWQTRWEQQHGFERVLQADWQWPRRGDWMARLDEMLHADPRPVVFAAHSLGCHLVAAWAAHSSLRQQARGALLVAPPDLARPDLPPQLAPWRPPLLQPLPFPSVLAWSTDDPFGTEAASLVMARAWGSTAWALGARGHLNADSGLGDWPEALARMQPWLA